MIPTASLVSMGISIDAVDGVGAGAGGETLVMGSSM